MIAKLEREPRSGGGPFLVFCTLGLLLWGLIGWGVYLLWGP